MNKTKVYLIIASQGEWEDYSEWIVSAKFNKKEAEIIVNRHMDEIEGAKDKFEILKPHAYDCDKDECELCEEFYDLQSLTCDSPYYRVKEIEVD